MRSVLLAGAVLLGSTMIVGGQGPSDRKLGDGPTEGKLLSQLQLLFPTASWFSTKEPAPPHFKAYVVDAAGVRTVIGVAFWTTELEPLERGYDGPIKMLVGLDMKGLLTGVIVAEHHEPYGYFSVDQKEFPAQFVGKSIRDAFKVGADVDAVSRASITIASATRSIRNSSRRVARELLPAPATGLAK